MFDQFTHLVAEASGWAYAVIVVFAVVDAVIPVVPSETVVITAGVVAAGDLSLLPLAIAAAAVGAFVGDNLAYGLGHRYGARATHRFFPGEKSQRRIDWAKGHLAQRGAELITAARFLPGGRTAVTLTAGLTRFRWTRFVFYDALAAILWASYAASLGYFGGRTFERQEWKGLLLALGIAFAVTVSIEAGRHLWRRRSRNRGDVRPRERVGGRPPRQVSQRSAQNQAAHTLKRNRYP
jgi:membrane protein DedA with SNARE-associated domain